MTSPRQIAANRRNAESSTGPTTPEGREASSQNAMTHGLTAQKLAVRRRRGEGPDPPRRMAARAAPEGPQQVWLAEQVVAASVRIDGCRSLEDAWQYRQASRAEGAWDVDRVAEVERIAEGLGKRPARVAAQLRQTLHGCDWLATQWRFLAEVLGAIEAEAPPGRSATTIDGSPATCSASRRAPSRPDPARPAPRAARATGGASRRFVAGADRRAGAAQARGACSSPTRSTRRRPRSGSGRVSTRRSA